MSSTHWFRPATTAGRARPACFALAAALALAGCSADPATPAGVDTYEPCTDDNRVGRFTLAINNDPEQPFSSADGSILDGALPSLKRVATVDGCTIYQPAAPVCTPACSGETVCNGTTCVAPPRPRPLGKVTITGTKAPVELDAINNSYSNSMSLAHPAFDEGADLTLSIAGAMGFAPLSLKGVGVGALEAPKTAVVAESGKPITITWKAPAQAGRAKVHVKLGVNYHGTLDTWFECDVPDAGSFTASAALMTELFKHGFSGFPSVELTRRTVDSASVPGGCAEFVVAAPITRPLKIAGFDDCNDSAPCPAGKTCGDDLLCR